MPLYEYHCKKCEHRFQDVYKIVDMDKPTLEPCPKCQELAIERLFPTKAPSIGDAYRLGIKKPPRDVTERLNTIKKNHPGSTIKV